MTTKPAPPSFEEEVKEPLPECPYFRVAAGIALKQKAPKI